MIVFGKLENEGIASATPLYVQKNVKFLVKPGTGCLADWRDFKTYKRMEKSKTKSFNFTMNDKNLDTTREDFHKVIILVTHREEEKLPLVYVYFYFDGKEHDLEPVPCHGNNLKKDKPRHSTNVSVRQKIRKLLTQGLKRK